MLILIRRLRHGPLRCLGPIWTLLGGLFRGTLKTFNLRSTTQQRIGPYGPFTLDGRFAFSNYESWGGGKNAGFQACVETCSGACCVLDVGAHIGLVALPVSRVLASNGKVFAFEPATANRELLQRHIKLNGTDNIVVVGELVGERDEEGVTFFEQDSDTGMNTVAPRPGQDTLAESRKNQISLDSFCRQRRLSPAVIKIDVEGAEIGVLRGAARTIAACRPQIFLSVHPEQIRLLGHGEDELEQLVADLGYLCLSVEGRPVAPLEALEYILKPMDGA